MAVLHYKELIAWQKAMSLAQIVYTVSAELPDTERFGLINQIRRAAVSIPSNIAEGQGRGVGKEFAHFLRIANGSRQEVETQLLLAEALGFLWHDQPRSVFQLSEEVGRLIAGLSRSISGQPLTTNN